ncbi:hypothetical protein PALU110988_18745 [Paenibacillus lupini]|uniref:hypothetical protein n=1 Tax=Paenibacillus lupini TaxID=1450204 RepID=UPI0014217905|nr:hypothetical protein [Paenibacillus lupini]NIK24228.1 hypothetical protein [Paenibacillus lupini]
MTMGNAAHIRTVFVQEQPAKDLGTVVNEKMVELGSDVEIIDIKFTSFSDEDGVGWHAALIVYKMSDK